MLANILILGCGGFGASLAAMLHKYGNNVILWSKFQNEIDDIRKYGENKKLLPGIAIDSSIELTTKLDDCNDVDLIIFAVPSFAVRETSQTLKSKLTNKKVVLANVAKGFEPKTGNRLSQIVKEEIPDNPIVVLSGPSHAEEIARNVPTTIVAASTDRKSAEFVQDILMNTNLRVYVNDDIIGVELGGALKNIIAVCAGICDGMELGDNTKAALMTRGLAEIARLGVKMGAKPETFIGLTGMGDLIVTCTSMHSRNRRAGILIGQGLSAQDAISRVGMTVEGCEAAKSALKISKEYNVEMPITEMLCAMLENKISAEDALKKLMGRPKRHENEKIGF